MASAIQMVSKDEYKLQSRGCCFTLKREGNQWAMYAVNAAVRAWNRGFAVPKYFDNLEAVEAKYKSWRGIAELLGK